MVEAVPPAQPEQKASGHCQGQYMAIWLALAAQKDTGGMARLARVIASKLPHHVIQRSNEVYCPRQFPTEHQILLAEANPAHL